jgi:hypothetical protein
MTKEELKGKIESDEVLINDLEAKLAFHNMNSINNGFYLTEDPFIPEYLGFTETIQEKNGEFEARIYTRDGFNISRYVSTDDPRWVILSPAGVGNTVLIENMYSGLVVLRSCGMNISMKEYFKENEIAQKKIDDRMAEAEEEAVDLLAGGRVV